MGDRDYYREYQAFRSECPLLRVADPKTGCDWHYFEWAKKDPNRPNHAASSSNGRGSDEGKEVVLCLPGVTGCAAQFYPQIKDLGKKGYHIMSVIWPPLYSAQEWAKAFDRFLDSVKVVKVHLVADGLGAFLAQYYTQFDRQFKSAGSSRRVQSLFLING